MPAMPTGAPPREDQYSARGWEPQRTYATPRGDRSARSVDYRASEQYQRSAGERVAAQRRTPDPGPDILNGQTNRSQNYGGGVSFHSLRMDRIARRQSCCSFAAAAQQQPHSSRTALRLTLCSSRLQPTTDHCAFSCPRVSSSRRHAGTPRPAATGMARQPCRSAHRSLLALSRHTGDRPRR